MTREHAAEVVAGLTLDEKAALTTGGSFWTTAPLERVGIEPVLLTDGPHGLRKQTGSGDHLGLQESIPATCFPPAVALGSTFDPSLAERVGRAIGREAQAASVAVVLGPGINIKRSPLCGRNFEYLSEDPLVSGRVGAGLVRGIQAEGVGASLKHFAANNQETDRMRVSADVDERPLHEIYLRAFEHVVRREQPWTVMCSYNRINGVPASQDPWLLTSLLREEWGFAGLVVSDWGAVLDRVDSLAAGLDLEMPAGPDSPAAVVDAVRSGRLPETTLDAAATRVVELVRRAGEHAAPQTGWSEDAHHALAREVAAAGVVLLKNDGLLPLARSAHVAVVGEQARTPRYQGAGSSLINPTRLDGALHELRVLGVTASFAAGYAADGTTTPELLTEAVAAAGAADVAVAFLGLPAALESEGYDRTDLELPAGQLELLDALLAANPRTVVVLSNGGVVRLAGFADRVPAIVEGWLLGQAGGGALADVLTGRVNPSGRLAETIPLRLADTPAYLDFPGEHGRVRYAEGLFVGHRWYDARELPVSFPFGHGLSYTTFEHRDLDVVADAGGLTVRLTVANTGDRDGHEVVQAYVAVPGSAVVRAPRELKGFARVHVPAGGSHEVTIRIDRADLAHWDTRTGGWLVEDAEYAVEVGASSRDLRQRALVRVAGDPAPASYTLSSTIGEILADPAAAEVLLGAMADLVGGDAMPADDNMAAMMLSVPLDRLPSLTGGLVDRAALAQLVAGLPARG